MKALKILLIGFILATGLLIQTGAQVADVKFDDGDYIRSYTLSHTGDTIEGVDSLSKSFYVFSTEAFKYDYLIEVKVDSMGQDGTLDIMLWGALTNDTYYPIDTIAWAMTSADTIAKFEGSNVRWPFLKPGIRGNSASDKARLGDITVLITGSNR